MRITCGKPVAAGMGPLSNVTPGPLDAMPWRDSDHHSYGGMPRRGMPVSLLERRLILSERVSRERRDWALTGMDRAVLQKG